MLTAIGILSLILLASPNPVELARPNKHDAVHPNPIQLHVHELESSLLPRSLTNLQAGFWDVGTYKERNQEYIIGIIIAEHLFPIVAPRVDLRNNNGRVKVRIDGNIANVTAPISNEDPLNNLFYKPFGPRNIRAAQIGD